MLLGASLYFGLNAESQRRASLRTRVSLSTGQIVRLERIIDGDTLTVQTEAGDTVPVRLLGIKSFSSQGQKDPTTRYGAMAEAELERICGDKPIRVLLNDPPQDKHGRTLAQLYVDDEDIALSLVKEGLTLVYTVYPFAAMSFYLQEQAAAQADQRGLWRDPAIVRRAEWLIAEWRRQAQ